MFRAIAIALIVPETVWAKSLKATADRLGQETINIGFALSLFGLAMGAIYLLVGKQDASEKITKTLMAVVLLGVSSSLIAFLKSIT